MVSVHFAFQFYHFQICDIISSSLFSVHILLKHSNLFFFLTEHHIKYSARSINILLHCELQWRSGRALHIGDASVSQEHELDAPFSHQHVMCYVPVTLPRTLLYCNVKYMLKSWRKGTRI
jgi:hypothetical protein